MPIDTICYGGVPKVSILDRFMSAELEEQPGILGATSTERGMWPSPEWKANNDVIIMSFRRSCSGDRGNICSGIAERFFKIQDECEDMKPELGEVESCQGASPDLIPTLPMTAIEGSCGEGTGTCAGKCIGDTCYEVPDEAKCVNYPISATQRTFEETFGINRRDGTPKTGTCNERWTCSSNKDEYKSSETEGPYILKGATCNSEDGTCSTPLEDYTSCENYNGLQSMPTDILPVPPWFCKFSTSHLNLTSTNFTCTEEDSDAYGNPAPGCTASPKAADPDSSERLCTDACGKDNGILPHHTGAWKEDKDLCCGDDKGEGGFPYTSSEKHSASSTTPGSYGTEVCDDYYCTDKYLQSNWIDNDCDGKVACKDTDCTNLFSTIGGVSPYTRLRTDGYDVWKTKLNPAGGLCCNEPSQCKQFLDPTLWTDGTNKGVDCGTVNNTCDCKPVGIEDDGTRTLVYRPGMVIRTCVPTQGELYSIGGNDRKFEISLLSPRTFRISARNIDEGSNCRADAVKIFFDEGISGYDQEHQPPSPISANSFHFQNTATVDCLVEVTIT